MAEEKAEWHIIIQETKSDTEPFLIKQLEKNIQLIKHIIHEPLRILMITVSSSIIQ